MSYKNEEIDRLAELGHKINNRVNDDYPHSYSYLDLPHLREIIKIAEAHDNDTDLESAEESECTYRFIASVYSDLGSRHVLADKYYTKMLRYSRILGKEYYGGNEEYREQLKEDIHEAICERNFYEKNDCSDIIETGAMLLTADEMDEIYNEAVKNKHLKYDPIEKTKAFLDIVDEADRYAEEHLEYKGRGSCHSLWRNKKEYLKKHGVIWKSPAEMNPDVRFD